MVLVSESKSVRPSVMLFVALATSVGICDGPPSTAHSCLFICLFIYCRWLRYANFYIQGCKTKIKNGMVNSIDPDEKVCYKPSNLDLTVYEGIC